jgi:phosphoserine phosphatase
MTKVLLIRHGHVEGIKPERFRGRADLELTGRGHREAQAVAGVIATAWRPKAIYTSPLKRCVATAAAISQACAVPWRVLNELSDIDYGEWQLRSYEEVKATHPALFAAWLTTPHLIKFPKGESLQDLVVRSADALRFLLVHHPDQTVVAVGHDSVNRALLLQLLDQPLSAYWRTEQDPCCINEIDIVDGGVRVRCINETYHLRVMMEEQASISGANE